MRLLARLALVGLGLFLALSLPAQTVRVLFVSGAANLQRPDEPALRPAVKGETVVIGTVIATGPDGRVMLTPMPGVQSIIAPNTTLTLESSSETRTSANEVTHHAVLSLKEGAVTTDLEKQEGVAYDYAIRTARGLAGARGTTYTVAVNTAGIETVVVTHGVIQINLTDGRSISVEAGRVNLIGADGSARTVGSLSELPAEEQAVAQEVLETTIESLATAVAEGLDLQPQVLRDAAAAAETLGIVLSPEIRQLLEQTLLILDQRASTRAAEEQRVAEIVSENRDDSHAGQTARDRYLAALGSERAAEFLALGESEQAAIVAHFSTIPASTAATYVAGPVSTQSALAALAEPGLTTFALVTYPANHAGAAVPAVELEQIARALIDLRADSAENYAFFKTLAGGTTFERADSAPDPLAWSSEAFTRTRLSFAEAGVDLARVSAYGAGDSVMDYSGGFVRAMLDAVATDPRFGDLGGGINVLDRIQRLGWGRDFADFFSQAPLYENVAVVGALSETEIAIIRDFDLSLHVLAQFGDGGFYSDSLVAALGQIRSENPAGYDLLRRLDDISEFESYSNEAGLAVTDYSLYGTLSQIVGHLEALQTAGQLDDALAIGFNATDISYFGLSGVQSSVARYRALPAADRADAIASDLLMATGIDDTVFAEYLGVWRTQVGTNLKRVIAGSHGDFHWLDHYATDNGGDQVLAVSYSYFRPLAEINALVDHVGPDAVLDLALLDGIAYTDHLPVDLLAAKTRLGEIVQTVNDLGSARFLLRELGIVSDDSYGRFGLFHAASDGLGQMLRAYALLDKDLILLTEHLENAYSTHFSTRSSYFFPSDNGYDYDNIYSVSFSARAGEDLHVGATRRLVVSGNYAFYNSQTEAYESIPTFNVADGRDVYLRASDLIQLDGASFSAGVRAIFMQAVTINLANLDFPDGSLVALTSRNGNLTFGSGFQEIGAINFISGVTYGGAPLDSLPNFQANSRGNIATGSFAAPAVLPSFTPKPIVE